MQKKLTADDLLLKRRKQRRHMYPAVSKDGGSRDCLYLPPISEKFAIYPVRNLPSASETLADGKRFICRRQTKNLQSASAPLAIGKMYV
ncbi:MAG TPA: hypothetical protein IAA30_10390 [Candidatus Treponema faecavium]|nr:hypothetical protein [Candidatus Treponema faecavium]